MTNFPAWWGFCMDPNRDGNADDSTDDGAGLTRWGWTYPTWITARRYIGQSIDLSLFTAMTKDQAGNLARPFFWNRMGGLLLGSGVDVVVVDWAWTSGHAIMEIQFHLGFKQDDQDGLVGPHTAHAINARDKGQFIDQCTAWRTDYYDMLGFRTKFPGLYTRAEAARILGYSLLGE